MATKIYRVKAAALTVKTAALAGIMPIGKGGGYTVVMLYRNALLPADVKASEVDRLLRKGMIEAVENG